jgi:hypothetical protein
MAKDKLSIPEVRTRLRELAEEHDIDELRELANELYRSSAIKRAPRRSPKLTPVLASEIRRYAKRHPGAHQQDIANHFGVNHGRVSEALNDLI